MTETRSGSPWLAIGLMLAAALAAVLMFAIWQIGSEFLRTLALILTVALALALVIVASAVAIRAWRRKDNVGETRFVDGTKTIIRETRVIDGRSIEAPKLYQLPAQSQGAAFPDLLRAAWQAGAIGSRSQAAPAMNEYVDAEVTEIGPEADGWDGDITH